jgi:outer membrane biogenesis lipoprotein LolB
MRRRLFAAAALAALLAACAAVPLAPRAPQPFDLVGRMLVTYSGGALTANTRWEHAPEQDQIWLMTPTGQTLAYIVDTPNGATLTSADQSSTARAASKRSRARRSAGRCRSR